MLIFKILLITVETICSFLLIIMILLQRAKGEGLGLAFGAEMGESIFGARASNVLVKATMWLGAIFILNTVLLATIYSNRTPKSIMGGSERPPLEQPVAPTPTPSAIPPAMPSMPTLPEPATQSPVPQSPVAQ